MKSIQGCHTPAGQLRVSMTFSQTRGLLACFQDSSHHLDPQLAREKLGWLLRNPVVSRDSGVGEYDPAELGPHGAVTSRPGLVGSSFATSKPAPGFVIYPSPVPQLL